MKKQLKHFVTFVYPGLIVSEESTEEIKKRPAFYEITMPKNAFGYRFFDREDIIDGKEVFEGKPKNYSPWHYKGRVMTLGDVLREKPESTILISNMKNNKIEKIVWTDSNQAMPLNDGDVVFNSTVLSVK